MSPDPRISCRAHVGKRCGCGLRSADVLVGMGGSFCPYNDQPSYPIATAYYLPETPSEDICQHQAVPRRSAGSAAERNELTRQQLDALTNVMGFNSADNTGSYYPTGVDLNAAMNDARRNLSPSPPQAWSQAQYPTGTSNVLQGLYRCERPGAPEKFRQNNPSTAQMPNPSMQLNATNTSRNHNNGNAVVRTRQTTGGSDQTPNTSNHRLARDELQDSSMGQKDSDDRASHRTRAPRR